MENNNFNFSGDIKYFQKCIKALPCDAHITSIKSSASECEITFNKLIWSSQCDTNGRKAKLIDFTVSDSDFSSGVWFYACGKKYKSFYALEKYIKDNLMEIE